MSNVLGDIKVKKFGKALICLGLACSFTFAGCSLVQRNTDRYLNRTVATAGDITITKQDLLSAYNSYGYQYVQNYNYTAEKAIKTTLDGLIDRKLVLGEAKKAIRLTEDGRVAYFKNDVEVATLYNQNVWQNSIWQQVFDGINQQISSYETEIKAEKGLDTTTDSKDEENPEFDPYKEYEKKVIYQNGKWTLKGVDLESAQDTKKTIGDFVQDNTGDSKISESAFKRYIKQLTLSYKDKNLTISDTPVNQSEFDGMYANLHLSTSEKIAFLYELDRIYNVYEESKYISEYQNVYERYMQVINDDFNSKVVNYYKQLVNSSYETYQIESEEDAYKAYVTAMQKDPSTVYYHKDFGTNSKGEKRAFVAVSHVLIKLSDDQTNQIKQLKTKLDTGVISQQEYDESCEKIKSQTLAYERDENGNKTGVTRTVAEVLAEINADLNKYSSVEDKAVAFNKYIYKYGQDSGMINATHYYAVNLDTTVDDTMVKAFADESRRLSSEMPDGGNVGNPVYASQDNYSGYHIIFNAGIYKNDLTMEQVNNLDYTDADYLYGKKLMLGTNKTMYDYIYDKIYSSNWSNYQNSIINTLKSNLKVTYYVSAYSDLY